MYKSYCVIGSNKTVAGPWKCCLPTMHVLPSMVGQMYTYLHTCSYTCKNSSGMTDVNRDISTYLASFHSYMCLWYSLTRAQVLPEEFRSLSPPVSEVCTDCLTAGVPGLLYRSLCPTLCPLQLAVLAFCSPCCRLRSKQLVCQPISALLLAHSPLDRIGMNISHLFIIPSIHPPIPATQM